MTALSRMDWSDAYGEQVKSLFSAIQGLLLPMASAFVQDFYDGLLQAGRAHTVLNRLDRTEFENLQRKQSLYFQWLMQPDLTVEEHLAGARQTGRIHALVGIEILMLTEAYNLYQVRVRQAIRRQVVSRRQRDILLWAISRRLTLDLEAQLESYGQIEEQNRQALAKIDQLISSSNSLADLFTHSMEILCELDGIDGALVARPDAKGRFQIEAATPGAVQAYADEISRSATPPFSVSAHEATGTGPAGRAWRSGKVEWTDTYHQEPAMEAWKAAASRAGIRSSAAVPLLDQVDQPMAILGLYSSRMGFFSSGRQQAVSSLLQQILSRAILRFRRLRVVPYRERQSYRSLLLEKRMEMLYQPIVDLRSGRLLKVEALARLRDEAGRLLTPGLFLPAFGQTDLLYLFEQGIRRACQDFADWQARGLSIDISINFPPEGLSDSRYHSILTNAMALGKMPPQRLCLEILEHEEITDPPLRDRFLSQMQDMGIRLALDDLGAGHSTLLRMRNLPFDEIKIDRGFVRSGLYSPQVGLGFIQHLTRLAHDMGKTVTVEGIENAGLHEAVAILGADAAQGYAIAHPMPAGALAGWRQNFSPETGRGPIRTPLGAIAGFLLWDVHLDSMEHLPQFLEAFLHAPCAVGQFLANHQPRNLRLEELLAEVKLAAKQGQASPGYQSARQLLVWELIGSMAREMEHEPEVPRAGNSLAGAG